MSVPAAGPGGLSRILPHIEASDWKIEQKQSRSVANFADANKRQLRVDLGLQLGDIQWKVGGKLERRRASPGVGAIPRTISARERDIAARVLTALSRTLGPASPHTNSFLSALRPSFDEHLVAEHLAAHHDLSFDLSEWLAALRRLAVQTYENNLGQAYEAGGMTAKAIREYEKFIDWWRDADSLFIDQVDDARVRLKRLRG